MKKVKPIALLFLVFAPFAATRNLEYALEEIPQNFLLGNIDFSDDGRFLGVFAGTVSRVNVDTGQVDVLDPQVLQHLHDACTINADGSRVAVNGVYYPNTSYGVFVYDFNTAQVIPAIEASSGDSSFVAPSISGNGQRVLFVGRIDLGNNADGSLEIFLADLPSGEVLQLTDTQPGPSVLTHYPSGINFDGSKACFNGDHGGPGPGLFLWEEGQGVRTLTDIEVNDPSMNQEGTAIVFSSRNSQTLYYDIYVYDLTTETLEIVAVGNDFDSTLIPEISGDGRWIVVTSAGNLTGQHFGSTVYVLNRQGGIYPVADSHNVIYPRISHGGERILFWQGELAGGRLFLGSCQELVPVLSPLGLALFSLALMVGALFFLRPFSKSSPTK